MSQPTWDGKSELPPVGCRCLKGHTEVLILAHTNVGSSCDPAVVYQSLSHPTMIDWVVCNVFSPLRSAEEKFIEEAVEVMRNSKDSGMHGYAEAMYQAGYRRLS